MKEAKFISINGIFYAADEAIFSAQNRAFRYGESVFETMRVSHGKVHFFYDHIHRLIQGMSVLEMEIPVRFTVDTIGLQEEIIKLVNKNKFFQSTRIRLTVYRKDGGLYSPDSDEINYLVEAVDLDMPEYQLNKKGVTLDLYSKTKKIQTPISSLKTGNSLMYVLASLYKKKNNLDECLLLTPNNMISEAISSNIFIVKRDGLHTPPLKDACLPGIMRQKVIDIAKAKKWPIHDTKSILPNELLEADEVFLTNSVNGVQWVMGFRDKRYFNKVATAITQELNDIIKESITH